LIFEVYGPVVVVAVTVSIPLLGVVSVQANEAVPEEPLVRVLLEGANEYWVNWSGCADVDAVVHETFAAAAV